MGPDFSRNLDFPGETLSTITSDAAERYGEQATDEGTPSFNLHIEEVEDDTFLIDVAKSPSPRLKDIQLPDGIQKRVITQYLTAIVIAILTTWVAIYYKNPMLAAGYLIAGALVLLGINTKLDFASGSIIELPVICASVSMAPLRDTTRVVFRTNNEIPSYYEFYVPGRHKDTFLTNYAYIIYYKASSPKTLLGYTQL